MRVRQNHRLAFGGSTRLAKYHAYNASPTCVVAQIAKTILIVVILWKKKRAMALNIGTGPISGNQATEMSEVIPITQNNHGYIVGPCKVLLSLSCQ